MGMTGHGAYLSKVPSQVYLLSLAAATIAGMLLARRGSCACQIQSCLAFGFPGTDSALCLHYPG